MIEQLFAAVLAVLGAIVWMFCGTAVFLFVTVPIFSAVGAVGVCYCVWCILTGQTGA